MSTIKAILKASEDGTLHLPLPPELGKGNFNVTATIEPVNGEPSEPQRLKGFGCLKGKLWMSPDFDEPLDDFSEYMK
jgi:hypothetical protein